MFKKSVMRSYSDYKMTKICLAFGLAALPKVHQRDVQYSRIYIFLKSSPKH